VISPVLSNIYEQVGSDPGMQCGQLGTLTFGSVGTHGYGTPRRLESLRITSSLQDFGRRDSTASRRYPAVRLVL